LLAAYFEGMFVNLCLPTSIGGDVLKVLRIGGTRSKQAAATTVVADRASGVVALILLLGLGILLRLDSPLAKTFVPLALAASILIGVMVLVVGRSALARVETSAHILGRLLRATPIITKAPWPRVIAWALVVQGLNVAAVAAAAQAIGANISVAGLLIATETASLAAALPVSVAGIGVREATLPMLLAADGVPRAAAIALGLTWSAIVLAIGMVGGIGHVIEQRRAARESVAIVPIPLKQIKLAADSRPKAAA
jgi:hypothetical protein